MKRVGHLGGLGGCHRLDEGHHEPVVLVLECGPVDGRLHEHKHSLSLLMFSTDLNLSY